MSMNIFDAIKANADKAKELADEAAKWGEKATEAMEEGMEKAQHLAADTLREVSEWTDKATETAKHGVDVVEEMAGDAMEQVGEWGHEASEATKEAMEKAQTAAEDMMQQATGLYDKATDLAQENLSKAVSAAVEALHKVEGLAGTSDASRRQGEPSRPPLGGFNLAVSEFSNNPDLAFDAAECLANEDHQALAAELGGLPPTTESVYENQKVTKAFPFADLLRESIDNAGPRPITPAYSDISLAIQKTYHPPDGVDPDGIVEKLRDRIGKAGQGEIF